MSIKSKIGQLGKAVGQGFTPRANLPRSDVQSAVEYVMDNAENVGTPYAPTDAEYLTNGAVAGLSNERAVTDTATISWDWATTGQAKASLSHLGFEDLTDPGADRGAFWDDSEGAFKWFEPSSGLGFVGTYLSITDPDLVSIVNEAGFVRGDLLYHNGTVLTRLGAGTDGQFLRTRGTSAAPDWQNISGGGDMLRANNLSDVTDAATARANIGIAIGTNVQAFDATLQSLSALGTAADRIAYTTGVDTWAETAITSFGRSLIDDANAAAARTTLALGTMATEAAADYLTTAAAAAAYQPLDSELTALAGLTSAADRAPYFTGSGTAALATLTAFGRSLIDDADASTARGTLGLGTMAVETAADYLTTAAAAAAYQPLDGTLTALAGVTVAADKLIYATGADAFSTTDLSSFARTILDDADAAAVRTTLGLVIGTNVQAYDAELAALAGLTSAADALPYFTGAGTAATTTLTAFARSILDDANEATFKATVNLEIGTDVQAWDADLDAVAALNSTGLAVRTGANTWAQRSIAGTANEITATNGDGVSGNPTLSLPASLTFTGKTVTGGTFAGPSFSGVADFTEAFKLSGDISPSQITSDQNDYAPTGFATAGAVRINSDAARNITGLAGGADGRAVLLHNVGGFTITLKDESGSSTAANRFALNADVGLAADSSIWLWYDSTSSRWRAIGGTGGGSGVTSVTAGTGLSGGTITTTGTIALSHLGIEALTDPNADRIFFWDDSASGAAWLALSGGLSISGTNLSSDRGLALLTSGTASSAATLDIVLTSYTAYRGIRIVLSACIPATDGVALYMRFSTDGGSSYDATGYAYANSGNRSDGAGVFAINSGSANQILTTQSAAGNLVGNGTNEGVDLVVDIFSQTDTALWSRCIFTSVWVSNNATPETQIFNSGAVRETAQDTDAIRFLFSSGNISTVRYAVYGYV